MSSQSDERNAAGPLRNGAAGAEGRPEAGTRSPGPLTRLRSQPDRRHAAPRSGPRRLGERGALDDVDRLVESPTANRLYNAACAVAILSEKAANPRLLPHALDLLTQALKAGFPADGCRRGPRPEIPPRHPPLDRPHGRSLAPLTADVHAEPVPAGCLPEAQRQLEPVLVHELGVAQDRAARPVGDDPARVQDHGPRADLQHHLEVVGGDQLGAARPGSDWMNRRRPRGRGWPTARRAPAPTARTPARPPGRRASARRSSGDAAADRPARRGRPARGIPGRSPRASAGALALVERPERHVLDDRVAEELVVRILKNQPHPPPDLRGSRARFTARPSIHTLRLTLGRRPRPSCRSPCVWPDRAASACPAAGRSGAAAACSCPRRWARPGRPTRPRGSTSSTPAQRLLAVGITVRQAAHADGRTGSCEVGRHDRASTVLSGALIRRGCGCPCQPRATIAPCTRSARSNARRNSMPISPPAGSRRACPAAEGPRPACRCHPVELVCQHDMPISLHELQRATSTSGTPSFRIADQERVKRRRLPPARASSTMARLFLIRMLAATTRQPDRARAGCVGAIISCQERRPRRGTQPAPASSRGGMPERPITNASTKPARTVQRPRSRSAWRSRDDDRASAATSLIRASSRWSGPGRHGPLERVKPHRA